MSTLTSPGLALVTGANRGLGFEAAKILAQKGKKLIITARDAAAGKAAAEKLGGSTRALQLNADSPASATALAEEVGRQFPNEKIDLLINNAGLAEKEWTEANFRRTIATNVGGPIHVTKALLPHMADNAVIVMVSSGLGQLANVHDAEYRRLITSATTYDELINLPYLPDSVQKESQYNSYSVSKAALNQAVQLLAKDDDLRKRNITVIAQCPGWCRTDMGSAAATRSAEEGGQSILSFPTNFDAKLNGLYLNADGNRFSEW